MTQTNSRTTTTVINNILPTLATCQQCQFMQSCKLSQQIVQLRQKLLFYQNKNTQIINQFIVRSQQQQLNILNNQYENILSNQIKMSNCQQMQMNFLEKQLQQLEQEMQRQRRLEQDDKFKEIELKKGFEEVQMKRFRCEEQYNQLLQELDQLQWKQAQMKEMKLLLQRTNFINVIYSIYFEDKHSFLNGEKITPDNSWKIVQILAFYHHKYPSYEPTVKINWNSMQILPNITKIKQPSYFDSILFNPIQISCNSASNILSTWMEFIVVEMKNLFEFLVKESGLNAKLKYEVTQDGQFEVVKNRMFKSQMEKFNLIVKYLLVDIDQINKLQFFAKEKRIRKTEQKQ